MRKNLTTLTCSYHTAGLVFTALGGILLMVGCTQLYEILGLSQEQIQQQRTLDQAATQHIIEASRTQLWQTISAAIAGAGTILSGLLARWLGTERKITKTLITSIEAEADNDLKSKVKAKASTAGIEPQLNARVKALT